MAVLLECASLLGLEANTLVSWDGFEPSTCVPFQLSNLLRSSVPSTLQPNDSFEPVSLRLITPKICCD